VSPTATKYLTYRIGLDDSAAGTRDLQSCPLLLLVREEPLHWRAKRDPKA
jgi:hypothetical protein